ncbi:MAG: cache domain-containing protein, partial [Methylobacteriaceae bacterium]|nr:cache domain-containing protein [Methylobacteriaceae bacterium]
MAYLDHRVGIIPRLLASAVLAMLVAVVAVQIWTLYAVRSEQLQQAQAALRTSMALLRHELAPFGADWHQTADGQLLLGKVPLNGRNDITDTVKEITGASTTIFLGDTRIATNVRNPDGSRGIGTKLAAGAAYDATLRDGRSYGGETTILGSPYLAIYEPIRDDNARTIGILFVGVPLARATAFMHRIGIEAAIGAVIVSLAAGIGYLWTLRATVRPLRDLTIVMHRISDGNLDCVVPRSDRTDEIGQIAQALVRLRDASAHARALEEAATDKARLETEKRAALIAMVENIEAETTRAIGAVGTRTAGMTKTAEMMAASAARTGMSASNAATASAHALANAQTVASTAEQLSASIREIGTQVEQSSSVVARAVAASGATRTSMEELNQDVGRIGTVVDMIGDIAAKTNLLALNATIEAARAGEAGKGFAVVASEVKALANQTAHSTKEIGAHIAQVRSATEGSVEAVGEIERTIGEINMIAQSIAEAVQQ